ncbi:MAG: hypothetical protein JWP87_2831 [Labilithrix sp.]|nr:hypothetical protein [Labilithrix sp.]
MRSRSRAYRSLVPLVAIAAVLALSGCNVLKKLKKKPPTSNDDTPTTSSFNDVDAFNKADVSRFIDEQRLFNETAFVRVITFARTAPDSGGTIVGVLDPDTLVLKHARRFGNTLITFNRAAFPGKRFAGWVPDSAFFFPITPPPPQTAIGGTCSMSLRISGFTPSKSTCSFNENVRSNSPSTLFFPCNGGAASVRFGPQTFSGTADKFRVALSNSTTSTFSGCQIRTTQTIAGSTPNLSYFLSETIVGGSCKGISTCTARASISAIQ